MSSPRFYWLGGKDIFHLRQYGDIHETVCTDKPWRGIKEQKRINARTGRKVTRQVITTADRDTWPTASDVVYFPPTACPECLDWLVERGNFLAACHRAAKEV